MALGDFFTKNQPKTSPTNQPLPLGGAGDAPIQSTHGGAGDAPIQTTVATTQQGG
jgi:hypothetical protein